MKKILLMALAGTLLFACQKPNQETPNGETKNVSIKILKETTRAALGQTVNEGAETELTAGTLFFFNASGTTVHSYTLTTADLTATMPIIITGVPATATTVAMIGNKPSGLALSPADFAAFKNATLAIDPQARMSADEGVNDGGEPLAVQGVALIDKLTADNAANPITAVADQTFTHEAAITLIPAVARIEIGEGAIKVLTGNDSNLTSFDFEGIYVNGYSPTLSLGWAQAATLFGAGIADGGEEEWSTAYLNLTPSQYLYDVPADVVAVSATTGIGSFAYHVFPGAVPQIVIKGSNFDYSEGTGDVDDTRYWIIDKYYVNNDGAQGAEIETFDAGTVYKIASILVGGSVPGDDPYDTPVRLAVTLTIERWDVQNVYVTPN
jgi:hypothetical protein